ncbi:MAG: hypothetical protein AAFV45_01510 [Pseudomonadota bacterium]
MAIAILGVQLRILMALADTANEVDASVDQSGAGGDRPGLEVDGAADDESCYHRTYVPRITAQTLVDNAFSLIARDGAAASRSAADNMALVRLRLPDR